VQILRHRKRSSKRRLSQRTMLVVSYERRRRRLLQLPLRPHRMIMGAVRGNWMMKTMEPTGRELRRRRCCRVSSFHNSLLFSVTSSQCPVYDVPMVCIICSVIPRVTNCWANQDLLSTTTWRNSSLSARVTNSNISNMLINFTFRSAPFYLYRTRTWDLQSILATIQSTGAKLYGTLLHLLAISSSVIARWLSVVC
jgi:hypothetical protein